MTTAAALVRDARLDAGLSYRALATRAGVPASTVSRIEHGTMDPTVTMLRRVLAGASRRLVVDGRPLGESPSISALATPSLARRGELDIDWTSLRAFADWARRHPSELPAALEDPPPRTGTPLDAILASFAEELSDTYGVDRPFWADDVPAVDPGWAPAGTPRMLERARAETPDTFRRRNLTLARADLLRADRPR